MTAFFGADVDQLRDLAARFSEASDRLEMGVRLTDGQLGAAMAWQGPSAEAFRTDWRQHHRLALVSAARALDGAADRLRQNSQQQSDASNDTIASGSGVHLQGHGPHARGGGGESLPGLFDGFWRDYGSRINDGAEVLLDARKYWNLTVDVAEWAGHAGAISKLAPWLKWATVPLELYNNWDETWQDLSSGNPLRMGDAVIRNAWTIATLYPPIGVVDSLWDLGVDSAEMFIDTSMGPGTFDRQMDELDQWWDNSLDEANDWCEKAIGDAVGGVFDGVMSFMGGTSR